MRVLLTDETGPTHNNLIANNVVTRNETDCGITVPGHNPAAPSASGQPQPSVAGVYDNVIAHNVVTFNGLKGDGAGVLFANATAGTASYNNLVIGNFIAGERAVRRDHARAHDQARAVRAAQRQQDHRKPDRHEQHRRRHAGTRAGVRRRT